MRFIGEDPSIPEGFMEKYLSGLLAFIDGGSVLNGTAHLNNTVFQYSFNLNNPKKAKIDGDIYLSDFEFSSENTDKQLKSLSISVTYDSNETISMLLDAVSPILSRKKVPSAKITLVNDEQCISFKHAVFTPQPEASHEPALEGQSSEKVIKKGSGKKQASETENNGASSSSYEEIKSGEATIPNAEQ